MSGPPVNLDRTLGAIFIGNIVAATLYGTTSTQSFTFFKGNHRDRLPFKCLIGLLWILDSFHLALITHGVYHYLVINYTNVSSLARPTWSLLCQVFTTCTSDLIVRCIFARRIWYLSNRNNGLLYTIIITSFFVFGSGIAFGVRGFIDVSFSKIILESWILYVSLGSSVIADGLVAASLCILLERSRTGFKSTDSLVNTLMFYSINTGLLTSVCAMACFVTFTIWPNEFVFIGVYFVLSKR
ncbi:hypothetical protein B0H34DRAFT_160112 [Crassisporium funariophilum]|nr:hypothetical protein B0H34DRAFT_160112 [Crassisporium funariophilum]